jgi:NAD(P)-dependent dehydrogenase (short-subunit alcohol dehydrogenase family)
MGLLAAKLALVTGGTTGLGLAIAERFVHEGARVVITGRDRDLGERAGPALGNVRGYLLYARYGAARRGGQARERR